MRKPYRVIVWGPGGLGAVGLWEILQSPAFELAGVRVYSEAKNGIDAGILIGVDPVGVFATTDVDALLRLDCDCVLYTARDMGNWNTDDEILRILEAGKNLVTPLPYHNAHLFRDASFKARLDAACQAGQSVFHATGIDPDLISDRVLLALTGLCTDVQQIRLQENWECTSTPPELQQIAGFGKSPEEARAVPMAAAVSTNFLQAIGHTVAEVLGVRYDRIEEMHDYVVASERIESTHITIEPGQVGRLTHRFAGYIDSKGDEPFFLMEYNWVLGNAMLPPGVLPGQYWIAEIEGRPSMRMVIDLRASLRKPERFYTIGNFKSEPGFHGTMAPCLQAIPKICAASPGVLPSFGPSLHWMQDFRDLVRSH